MPAIALNRSNAWTYWSKGLISATNMDSGLMVDLTNPQNPLDNKVLSNLAIKRGHNAIRLWFGYAGDYSINENDITAVSIGGWNSTQLTAQGVLTYAQVRDRIKAILDSCANLGIGVLMVTNYGQVAGNGAQDTPSGLLWDPSSNYKLNLAKFWQQTYQSFGSHSALIGFDILNEPHPLDKDTFEAQRTRSNLYNWCSIAQFVINKIRATETDLAKTTTVIPLPLIVEGVYSGSADGLRVFDAPNPDTGIGPFLNDPQNRIVYSFHYYDPLSYTGQGIAEWGYEEIGLSYPLTGCTLTSGYLDGQAHFEFREYQNTDQVKTMVAAAISFRDKYKAPIFVGEFSACQPRLSQVYPVGQAMPDQRVSNVQNNVSWQAPLLNKLASIASTSDLTTQEAGQVATVFNSTKRRWITRLEVDGNLNLIATIGNIVTSDKDTTGFRIGVSPYSIAQLQQMFGTVNAVDWYTSVLGSPRNDTLCTTPNAQVVASYPLSPTTTGYMRGKAYASSLVSVKLVRHDNKINFGRAPVGLKAGDAINGLPFTLPGTTTQITLPVALLWLDSPLTGDQIDQCRFDYARDTLYTWQSLGFSWAWHADETNSSIGMVAFRPSKQISELLASASSGARLAKRN